LPDGPGDDHTVPPALQGARVRRYVPGLGGGGECAVDRGADAELDDRPGGQDRDLDTLGEITWSTLHGLVTLTASHRLRPSHEQERLTLLIHQLTTASAATVGLRWRGERA